MSNNHNCGGNSSSKITCLVGPRGRKGPKGPMGFQGPQGATGATGQDGADIPPIDNYGNVFTAYEDSKNPYYGTVIVAEVGPPDVLYYPVIMDTSDIIPTTGGSITLGTNPGDILLASGYYLVYYSLTVAGGDVEEQPQNYSFAIALTDPTPTPATTIVSGSEQGQYIISDTTTPTLGVNIAGTVIVEVTETTETLNLVLVNPAISIGIDVNDILPIIGVTVTILRLGDLSV